MQTEDQELQNNDVKDSSLTGLLSAEEILAKHPSTRPSSRSTRTKQALERAVSYISAWHEVRYGVPLPPPETGTLTSVVVLEYMVDHLDLEVYGTKLFDGSVDLVSIMVRQRNVLTALFERGARTTSDFPAMTTLDISVRYLRFVYEFANRAAFCAPEVMALQRMILKEARERSSRKTHPLTGDALKAILSTCDDGPLGIRDRALLLFSLAVGEFPATYVAKIRAEHLDRRADGTFVFDFRATGLKARHKRIGLAGLIEGGAAKALASWLDLSQVSKGPIFCRISKYGVPHISSKTKETLGLTDQSCHLIIRKRVAEAELKGCYCWTSLHVTAPSKQDKIAAGAIPGSRKLLYRGHLSVDERPNQSVEVALPIEATNSCFTTAKSSQPPIVRIHDPVLVLVKRQRTLASENFRIQIEGIDFRAKWGRDPCVMASGHKGFVRLADAFYEGELILDKESGRHVSLKDLSPAGIAAFHKLFGVLGPGWPEETTVAHFLKSPAGKIFGQWASRVRWDRGEQDPRVQCPRSMIAYWLRMGV